MPPNRHPVTEAFLGCAIEVHRHLGPGLLESAYEHSLAHELTAHGIQYQRQVPVALNYKGTPIDCGYRIDLLVEDDLLIELKSVDRLHPVHVAQVLTYLRLSGARQALLLNFNVPRLRDGLKSYLRSGELPTPEGPPFP